MDAEFFLLAPGFLPLVQTEAERFEVASLAADEDM